MSGAGAAPTDVRAPYKFLGNWSSLDRQGSLRYDHGMFEIPEINPDYANGFPYAVKISGPGGSAQWTGAYPARPNSGWKTIEVPIRVEAWEILSGDWPSLLSNVTNLDIRIEHYANSGIDEESIDNVRLSSSLSPEEAPVLMIRTSQVELSWQTRPNRQYKIQYRSNLTNDEWVDLGLNIAGDGTIESVTDSIPLGQPRRFYRVIQLH